MKHFSYAGIIICKKHLTDRANPALKPLLKKAFPAIRFSF